VGLSAIRATAAWHALVLDDLAIKVVLGLDNAAKEHPAVYAGVGALEADVVRLYGVVVILGWVRVVRYSHGVNLPIGWPGPEEWRLLRDHLRCEVYTKRNYPQSQTFQTRFVHTVDNYGRIR
jgi:hypothetical protein